MNVLTLDFTDRGENELFSISIFTGPRVRRLFHRGMTVSFGGSGNGRPIGKDARRSVLIPNFLMNFRPCRGDRTFMALVAARGRKER
jgi:hypothetical protein